MLLDFAKSLGRSQKVIILLAVDIVLVPLSILLAVAVQLNTLSPFAWLVTLWPVVLALMICAGVGAFALGIPRIQLKSYHLSAVGRSAVLAVLLGMGFAVLVRFSGLSLPPGIYVVFALCFLFLTVASRVLMLQALLAIYRGDGKHIRVLIYGAGATGMQLALALRSHESITPVAFIDDNTVLQKLTVAGLPVYRPQRLPALIAAHGIDRVLLAMPSLSQPRQTQIARRVGDMGVEVQALPSFAQLIGEEALVEKLAPVLPGALLGRARLDEALMGSRAGYRDKTVLISGAGGSIGSELCRQILNCRPARLVLMELSEFALYSIDRELMALAEGTGCEIVPVLGSVTDRRQVRSTLEQYGVQVVLHAAAYKHVPLVQANPVAGLVNNVLGTRTLALAARAAGVERFILISTDKAVRPEGVMGASKRLAELVVGDLARRSSHTIFSMVRFGNVLGSSGSVIPLFQEQISRGGPVTVTDARVTRYFMTVQEAAQLVLRAGSMATGGEIFVLDMGQPVAIRKLARQVIEASGYTVRDVENPEGDIEIVFTGMRPGEKLHEELSIGEGLVTTAHPKIFQAREDILSEFEIARALRALRISLISGNPDHVRNEALRLVQGHEEPPRDKRKY